MNYKEKTAERLLQLRTEHGLTQKELAEKVDTSPQNIDLYESGKRKINVEILGKVADVFNVSTDYLLGRNKDIKDPISYFRIDTTGLDKDQVDDMTNQLTQYQAFLKEQLMKKTKNNGGVNSWMSNIKSTSKLLIIF